MKLTALILFLFCLQVSAKTDAQQVTINTKNAPLEKVIQQVRLQTGYAFFYSTAYLKKARPVTVNLDHAPIEQALKEIFKNQPFLYQVNDKMIVIKEAPQPVQAAPVITSPPKTITGMVTDSAGNPLPGATIRIKGMALGTMTDVNGRFILENVPPESVIVISFTGYSIQEINIGNHNYIKVQLLASNSKLDEIQVIAYGTTTQRLTTGAISKVNAADIADEPVSNPINALEGRVSGLVVTQSNGYPGSSSSVQIRGQNSISQGSNPLFIIDGVPYADNNSSLSVLGSALGVNGLSPFSMINPNDIESIEVLKDADATAIYGSRGANGVILITTKKGKNGKTSLDINLRSGVSNLTKTTDYMNTQQYLQMRRSAFASDGITPTVANAPDLMVWDTTRYTNMQKLLFGNNASYTDANISISGGSPNTTFMLSGGYHRETTVLNNDVSDQKGDVRFSVNHHSTDQRFNLNFTATYTSDGNHLLWVDPSGYQTLPPDVPSLYTSDGQLNWQQGGVSFYNPLSLMLMKYNAKTDNLIANMVVSYRLFGTLVFKTNLGYNMTSGSENRQYPTTAQDPNGTPSASASFGNTSIHNWIIEPQLTYGTLLWKGKIDAIAGATIQRNNSRQYEIDETGYTSDAMLGSLAAGSAISNRSDSYNTYRYAAVFARLTYNLADKYILNATGRRDGSSRFGPGRQFANFGSVGAAWLFSKEDFFKSLLPVVSFGKLRASYGVTGNDQIGNYKYLEAWTTTTAYNGITTLKPTNLYNNSYGWEVNRKLEVGMDLGFLNDHILLTADVYQNRSSNQLINYSIPSQTGFSNIVENLSALVQNRGIEINIISHNIDNGKFKWTTNFNLTLPQNKLLAFPNLSTSAYYSNLVIGKPLSSTGGYIYTGVSPSTGLYTFKDVNNDGSITYAGDYVKGLINLDPKFYGGIQNTLTFKRVSLDAFFDFKKLTEANYFYDLYYNASIYPGTMYNLPTVFLNAWKNAGDHSSIERLTTGNNADATNAMDLLAQSNGAYSDASYIRLKTLALSYTFPQSTWLTNLKVRSLKIYLQAQNLITWSAYKVADPETQSIFTLSPLRTVTAGINANF